MSLQEFCLGEIAESVDYGLTASAIRENIGPRFLRITDIQDDHVDWSSVPYCNATQDEERANILKPGDIVFARTGATTGKSYLIRQCPDRTVFASYLIRVRPSRRVDANYLWNFFRSKGYWSQIRSSARGAAQPGVNSTVLKELLVPLPPLNEQRRIAAILDQADGLLRKRRAALGRLQRFREQVFVESFGDWSRPGYNGNLINLGERLEFITSGSRGWAAFYKEKGSRFLRIQNVKNDELDLSNITYVEPPDTAEARRTRVKIGDVLLSITADLGRSAVVPDDIGECYINQHLCILRSSNLEPNFLSAAIASPAGQKVIQGMNREGVKAGLNFDDVCSFKIPDVGRSQQQAFAARVGQIDKLKIVYRAHLAALDALLASLQHRAFRGEL